MNASIRKTPCSTRGLDDRLGLREVHRERLLAQHVLAGLGGRDRPARVQRVRRRDVDGVDLVVREQSLVAAVRADVPEPGDARAVAAGDGDQPSALRGPEVVGEDVRDASGRDDPPAQRLHSARAYASQAGCFT